MAYATIELDADLDASGGANDTATASANIDTDSAAVQWELTGATTNADVHLEARLSDQHSWADFLTVTTGATNGDSDGPTLLDVDGIPQLRVRVVNQDGTNAGHVTATVTTA